jgi:hypothetical protein
MTRIFGIAVMSLVAACGGSTTSNTVASCDVTNNGVRNCTESTYSSDPGGVVSAGLAQGCTQQHGTAGTGCSRAGAVAGCNRTVSNGAATVSATVWSYAGTAAALNMACTQAGGTPVSP